MKTKKLVLAVILSVLTLSVFTSCDKEEELNYFGSGQKIYGNEEYNPELTIGSVYYCYFNSGYKNPNVSKKNPDNIIYYYDRDEENNYITFEVYGNSIKLLNEYIINDYNIEYYCEEYCYRSGDYNGKYTSWYRYYPYTKIYNENMELILSNYTMSDEYDNPIDNGTFQIVSLKINGETININKRWFKKQ